MLCKCFGIGLGIGLWLNLTGVSARAQVVEDPSIGTNVNPIGTTYEITGGRTIGGNLFHSFSRFDVPTGGIADFQNDLNLVNIFSRVTGGLPATIDGVIQSKGNANFFLLSPAGIVFGQNARLDVGGSFVGTTADAIQFGDVGNFSARNLETPPSVLSINPSALVFAAQLNSPAPIAIRGNGQGTRTTNNLVDTQAALRVKSDRTLALVGGNLSFEGATLKTPGGRIELGAVRAGNLVGLTPAMQGFSLDYSKVQSFQDIQLSQQATIDASGISGGDIRVFGKNITVVQGSQIETSTIGTANLPSGSLEVIADESIALKGSGGLTGLFTGVYEGAIGNAGNIILTANSAFLENGASIQGSTFGRGDAGNIFLQIKDSVSLTGDNTIIISSVQNQTVKGNAGNISITARAVDLKNGAQINAFTRGQGNTGNINIIAKEAVKIDGVGKEFPTGIFNNIDAGGVGDSGILRIEANSLSLTNGAQLDNSVRASFNKLAGGKGKGGVIDLNIQDDLTISKGRIFSSLGAGAEGRSGNVNIQAGSFSIQDDGQIVMSTSGTGNAGNIKIEAKNTISIVGTNSLLVSNVEASDAKGNAGNIFLSGDSILVKEGAQINSFTRGQGNAGNVTIITKGAIIFDGVGKTGFPTGIYTNISAGGVGDGGVLSITANSLALTNGAYLDTSVRGAFDKLAGGKGKGGVIDLNVQGDLIISNSRIFSSLGAGAEGRSGNVNIQAGSLSIKDSGTIEVSTSGIGDAGDIRIHAKNAISVVGASSFIVSNVQAKNDKGNAGNIFLSGDSITVREGAQINSFTRGRGNTGNVTIIAKGAVIFDGVGKDDFSSGIFNNIDAGGVGDGGLLSITANSLALTNGAYLDTSVRAKSDKLAGGKGKGGVVDLNIQGDLTISKGFIFSSLGAGTEGRSGDVNIQAGSLSIKDGGQIEVSTSGTGNAGNIKIQTKGAISLTGENNLIVSNVQAQGAKGNAGNIFILGDSITVREGSQINSFTRGQGNVGNVTVITNGAAIFDGVGKDGFPSGIFNNIDTGGVGDGGILRIAANSLVLTNGAQLDNSIREASGTLAGGTGRGGIIDLSIQDNLTISNSRIFSSLSVGAQGQGGDVNIQTGSFLIDNGGSIEANTFGRGNAGNISIRSKDSVIFNNGYASTNVGQDAEGTGGDITIQAKFLEIVNGGQIAAITKGKGDAGNIFLGKSDQPITNLSITGIDKPSGRSSALFAFTTSDNPGGDIRIFSDQLQLLNGAVIDARTGAKGDSGSISIQANQISIQSGGQILATSQGNGSAKDITVNAEQLNILGSDPDYIPRFNQFGTNVSPISAESGIFTRSRDSGNAGKIDVTADWLTLDQQARIDAESITTTGGNIALTIPKLLLLRNGSQITASAGNKNLEKGGDGGNININSRFIVAIPKENSDISANATQGKGGSVFITTQGIFGLEFRLKPTELSDITASSDDFNTNGIVIVNTPDNTVLQNSLTPISNTLIDTNQILSQSCLVRQTKPQGTFYILGNGSLPPRPEDPIMSDYPTNTIQPTTQTNQKPWKIGDPIIEPQGFFKLADGRLIMGRECPAP